MDVKSEVIRGLTSNQKFLPYWYTYDAKGEKLYTDIVENSKYYYFTHFEKELLQENIAELLSVIPKPFLVSDLGCGNGKKSLYITDEYFKEESSLKFVPIDVCEDILQDVKEDMRKLYCNKIDIDPIPGVFETSVPTLFSRYWRDRKLLACFGGTLQNPIYEEQIKFLSLLSNRMNSTGDFVMFSIDITQDKDVIELAYMDPEGYFRKFYERGIQRLIEDYGADIQRKNFELEGAYKLSTDPNIPGAWHVWFRSLCQQTVNIDKLGLTVEFEKDEKVMLAEKGCRSYKYNDEQLQILFKKSGLQVVKMWKNEHIAVVLLKKQS